MGAKGDDIARHVAQYLGTPVHFCGSGREDASTLVAEAYARRAPIVGICGAGVLVRLLGTDLGDKAFEPPVLAVSADGKIAVPVLGSHRGANALARWIADGFTGTAAITSFSDTLYDFSLEDLPPGYVQGTPDLTRPLMAALLNGEKLKVHGPSHWLAEGGYPVDISGTQHLFVTHTTPKTGGVYIHPKTLSLAMATTGKADVAEIITSFQSYLDEHDIALASIACLSILSTQSKHKPILEFADHFNLPIRAFTKRDLEKHSPEIIGVTQNASEADTPAQLAHSLALKAGALAYTIPASSTVSMFIGLSKEPIEVKKFGRAI